MQSVGEMKTAFWMSGFPKFWRGGIVHHKITIKGNEQQKLESACKGLQEDGFRMLLSEK
jgi:hypothetical protein